ncbi:hypothetical protein [Acerihabitans arboris]|uniref:Uncharacterized protein n=1 Tax=Acerihabitans arboris TaxID=2691583 RepID=A0A845SS30_9GAMM|nr:hypothetical protein [Acerihabitans arboris]NDL65897.1 hypothetical protein [Acerihabitans arboris]
MVSHILFGAGASHGSEPNLGITPPLGKKLFENLLFENGLATTLPDNLKEIFVQDFEQGMLEFIERCNKEKKFSHVIRFQNELAQYLLKFMPTANNLYLKLLNNLKYRKYKYSSLTMICFLNSQQSSLGCLFVTAPR